MPQLLHDVANIETPEQVTLDLPLAGIGSRAYAYVLDLVWQALILVVAIALAFGILAIGNIADVVRQNDDGKFSGLTLLALAVFNLVFFFVNFGYFAFFEVVWRGQSPGKRQVGLRVLRDGGYPMNARAAIVRNVLRVVDFLPLAYFAGILIIFLGRQGKRLGDYAGGTVVIKERRAEVRPTDLLPRKDNDAAKNAALDLARQFISRRASLAPDVRARIAQQMASRVATVLGHESPVDAEAYLEGLLADDNRGTIR